MDLKSRGRAGRSFVNRAVHRVSSVVPRPSFSSSNIEDEDLTKKVEALFAQDLLFERLHSEPRWKRAYTTSVKGVKNTAKYVKKQKFATKAIAVLVLMVSVGGVFKLSNRPSKHVAEKPNITTVAGASTPGSTETKLPKESPSFQMLKPLGRKNDNLEIVRVSPEGNDPVYAFTDRLDTAQINVSEQLVPKTFDYNRDVELERVAKDFQATNVIQIDSTKVYHGLNEKTKAQSLVFIKSDLLIFIKSNEKLTDEQWTGYILTLQKY